MLLRVKLMLRLFPSLTVCDRSTVVVVVVGVDRGMPLALADEMDSKDD